MPPAPSAQQQRAAKATPWDGEFQTLLTHCFPSLDMASPLPSPLYRQFHRMTSSSSSPDVSTHYLADHLANLLENPINPRPQLPTSQPPATNPRAAVNEHLHIPHRILDFLRAPSSVLATLSAQGHRGQASLLAPVAYALIAVTCRLSGVPFGYASRVEPVPSRVGAQAEYPLVSDRAKAALRYLTVPATPRPSDILQPTPKQGLETLPLASLTPSIIPLASIGLESYFATLLLVHVRVTCCARVSAAAGYSYLPADTALCAPWLPHLLAGMALAASPVRDLSFLRSLPIENAVALSFPQHTENCSLYLAQQLGSAEERATLRRNLAMVGFDGATKVSGLAEFLADFTNEHSSLSAALALSFIAQSPISATRLLQQRPLHVLDLLRSRWDHPSPSQTGVDVIAWRMPKPQNGPVYTSLSELASAFLASAAFLGPSLMADTLEAFKPHLTVPPSHGAHSSHRSLLLQAHHLPHASTILDRKLISWLASLGTGAWNIPSFGETGVTPPMRTAPHFTLLPTFTAVSFSETEWFRLFVGFDQGRNFCFLSDSKRSGILKTAVLIGQWPKLVEGWLEGSARAPCTSHVAGAKRSRLDAGLDRYGPTKSKRSGLTSTVDSFASESQDSESETASPGLPVSRVQDSETQSAIAEFRTTSALELHRMAAAMLVRPPPNVSSSERTAIISAALRTDPTIRPAELATLCRGVLRCCDTLTCEFGLRLLACALLWSLAVPSSSTMAGKAFFLSLMPNLSAKHLQPAFFSLDHIEIPPDVVNIASVFGIILMPLCLASVQHAAALLAGLNALATAYASIPGCSHLAETFRAARDTGLISLSISPPSSCGPFTPGCFADSLIPDGPLLFVQESTSHISPPPISSRATFDPVWSGACTLSGHVSHKFATGLPAHAEERPLVAHADVNPPVHLCAVALAAVRDSMLAQSPTSKLQSSHTASLVTAASRFAATWWSLVPCPGALGALLAVDSIVGIPANTPDMIVDECGVVLPGRGASIAAAVRRFSDDVIASGRSGSWWLMDYSRVLPRSLLGLRSLCSLHRAVFADITPDAVHSLLHSSLPGTRQLTAVQYSVRSEARVMEFAVQVAMHDPNQTYQVIKTIAEFAPISNIASLEGLVSNFNKNTVPFVGAVLLDNAIAAVVFASSLFWNVLWHHLPAPGATTVAEALGDFVARHLLQLFSQAHLKPLLAADFSASLAGVTGVLAHQVNILCDIVVRVSPPGCLPSRLLIQHIAAFTSHFRPLLSVHLDSAIRGALSRAAAALAPEKPIVASSALQGIAPAVSPASVPVGSTSA
jgi:hypothetical protein